ncbi:S8 family serine peptidase [bacterium]|nr:S8 family serine peptidase [bacterium]
MKATSLRRYLSITVLSLFLFSFSAKAEGDYRAYLIKFNSKPTDGEVPISDLALSRRAKFGIKTDASDYHVNPAFIKNICSDSIQLLYSLKWHNAIVVKTKMENLDFLLDQDYIESIEYVGIPAKQAKREGIDIDKIKMGGSEIFHPSPDSTIIYGNSKEQIQQIGLHNLHRKELYGKGVKIAVFDAGFYNIDLIPAFSNHRRDGRLWHGYDLVDLDNNLTDVDNHGTAVSSCISGYHPGKFIGSAPLASLYLFRTENSATEYPLEELNWCKAAEIADSIGVDMVSSSLGYTRFDDPDLNYSHDDLDGESTYVSLAAKMLVAKGVLVVNSAGNSGSSTWRKIGTPADVSEVLTVGAVDNQGRIGSFSSKGYNALGQIKPDVCAMGVKTTVASTFGSYYKGNGTSYSTPIVSGAMALLLEAFPEASPIDLISIIHETATRNSIPDSMFGYGVLNAHAAYMLLNYKKFGFIAQPDLTIQNDDYLLFNNAYHRIRYKLYEEHQFLGFIPYKKKVKEEEILNQNRFTYIKLRSDETNCTVKYTLKLKLKSSVEKCGLKYRHLSLCES